MILETARLRIRHLEAGDAAFIVCLLNDPAFLRFIGDRGVRTEDDAVQYIANGPAASYTRHGFGLCAVERRESPEPIGICGLLKREDLDAPDLGFAFLPSFRSRGFAREAAEAVLHDAAHRLGIRRVLAIVQPDNATSIALLERLAFRLERLTQTPRGEPLRLYARALTPPRQENT